MKPLPFLLCSLSILFSAHAEPPNTSRGSADPSLSLGEVTRAILTNNPSLKEARARWESMKQRVPQAAAWDDPKVTGTTRLGRFVDVPRNGFADQILSVEQMIPISGKNRSRERIAAAEALGALEDLRRKEYDVVARGRVAWFRLVRDRALLELNHTNESLLNQTVEVTRARLEVGNQGQADLLVAQNELYRLEESQRDLSRAVSDDETQLKVLMNRDAFASLASPPDASPALHEHFSSEQLRAQILNHRPEVRSAEADVTVAKARLELAKREWIPDPTVSLEAQRYNGAGQAVSEVDAGVSFTLPWLNGKKYRAEEKEAQSGLESAQRKLEGARAEALGLLRDQTQKIETAHHHLELFQSRLIPTARQTVQANRANYETGRTGFLDLVLSERNLRELEAMYQQHLSDYGAALAELEMVVGADLRIFSAQKENAKGGSK